MKTLNDESHQIINKTGAQIGASAHAALQNVVSIVAAYVGHNSLRAADLPDFIAAVHSSIRQLSEGQAVAVEKAPDSPAVAVKKSVTKDHIVCLEDGKKFKSLRRHLSSFHNLTPDAYRAKWGLPSDYPMVAPTYSATRSQLAKDSGLGQVNKTAESAAPEDAKAPEPVPAKKASRGRPKRSA